MIKKSLDLEERLKHIERRLYQLECPHHIKYRIFNAGFLVIHPTQHCSHCDKIIVTYAEVKEYKEAKRKWHQEMIYQLEDENDKKSNI